MLVWDHLIAFIDTYQMTSFCKKDERDSVVTTAVLLCIGHWAWDLFATQERIDKVVNESRIKNNDDRGLINRWSKGSRNQREHLVCFPSSDQV